MSIPAIGPAGFVPFVAPSVAVPEAPAGPAAPGVTGPAGPGGVQGAGSADFASLLTGGIERLDALHQRADHLAVQAATGDLSQLHDYTITATEAAVSTQLTTAVRNKALEAFQEIMRMAV